MPYPDTDATEKAEKAYADAIAAHQTAAADYAQLRAKVEDGAEVEPAALTEAAAKAEHAELRIEARHRDMASARMRARQASMTKLALEICDYDTDEVAKSVVDDFRQIEAAVNALVQRVRVHDKKVSEWRQWAANMGAHHNDYSAAPPAGDAGIGLPTNIGAPNGIQHDSEMICHVSPAAVLVEIADALHAAAGELGAGVAKNPPVNLALKARSISQQLVQPLPNSGRAADWVTAAHFREG